MKIILLGDGDIALGDGGPEGLSLAMEGLPAIFPRLRSGNIHFSVDGTLRPERSLFATAHALRRMKSLCNVHFDGVGSLSVSVTGNPCLKIAYKSEQTIKSWETQGSDYSDGSLSLLFDAPANSFYRRSRADPQAGSAQIARSIFNTSYFLFLPKGYGAVDYDSYEFWTVLDAVVAIAQETLAQATSGGGEASTASDPGISDEDEDEDGSSEADGSGSG